MPEAIQASVDDILDAALAAREPNGETSVDRQRKAALSARLAGLPEPVIEALARSADFDALLAALNDPNSSGQLKARLSVEMASARTH